MNPELRARGYIATQGLLEPGLARMVYKTLLLKHWRGECFRDNHVPTAVSVTNIALTDALLLDLRPRIEAISGCRLCRPTAMRACGFHDALSDTLIVAAEVSALDSRREGWRGGEPVVPAGHQGRDGGRRRRCLSRVRDGSLARAVHRERDGKLLLHYVVAGGPQAANYFDGNLHRFPPSISEALT